MKNFLNKEIKLCLSPVNFIFLSFCCMILIPNYPCYVSFFYLCLSCFFIFNNAELNKDIQYSMILPITKKDIVKSRCILVAAYQLVGAAFCGILAFISKKYFPIENKSGIESNFAFFGLAFILITIFNFSFFTRFYKKAEKPGTPFFISSILFWVFYFIFELPIWLNTVISIPYFKIMDSCDKASLIKQLPVFAAGIVIYGLGWILTYKKSASHFEKVDL